MLRSTLYLVQKAKEVGYHAQVILAGRAINDSMPRYVAGLAIKGLNKVGKTIKGSNVLIMGLTYKEDGTNTWGTPASSLLRVADPKHEKPSGFAACGTGCSITSVTTTAGVRPPNSKEWNAGVLITPALPEFFWSVLFWHENACMHLHHPCMNIILTYMHAFLHRSSTCINRMSINSGI